MKPSPGRIVQYKLTAEDVTEINRRRADARENAEVGNSGFILHIGTPVMLGDKFPLMVVKVLGETDNVNGQIHLDGNDLHWVTCVSQGYGIGQYAEFPRV